MASTDTELTPTLVQVANLYYNENLSQREIAAKLGVSRSLIALYLQKARDQHIVKIEVINPQDTVANLALELRSRTGIDHAVVVPHGHISLELTRRAIGAAAAQFLDERLQDGDVLGLGWGRATLETVELLAPTRPRNIDVVPLLGETGSTRSYSQMNHMVFQTAQRFGGNPTFLLAPMLVGSKRLRDLLIEDHTIGLVVERWQHLTITCFGIGALPPTPGMTVYIGDEYVPLLEAQGAVGDICVHPFDRQGRIIANELTERMIGVSVEQLGRVKCRIAVAAGAEKATALVGALKTGLITTLFVDAGLAEAALPML